MASHKDIYYFLKDWKMRTSWKKERIITDLKKQTETNPTL